MGSSSDRKARDASTNEGDPVDDNVVKSSAPVDRLRLPEKKTEKDKKKDRKKDRKKDKLTEIPDKQKKTAMHINTDDTLDKKDSSDVEHTIHRAHAEDPDDDAAAPASVISTVDDTLPAATCVSAQRQQPQAKVKAGLPRWIAQPTLIPANLADTAYTRALDDHRLQLSAAMLERCRAFGMERLFPVQVAVVDALAGGQAQRGDVVQTKAVSKKRKKDDCATSTAVDPWERQFLYANSHPGDLCVSAPTGSGKTLGYVIPIVEMLRHRRVPCLRALVILPTRDLVRQVRATFEHFAKGTDLRVVAAAGGSSMSGSSRGGKDEMDSGAMATSSSAPALSKVMRRERVQIVGHVEEAGVDHPSSISGGATVCDVLICTPGRLVDHLTATPGFTLQHLRWLIIDEADRLLNQTFDGWLDKTLASAHGETAMASRDGNALPTGLMSFRDDPLDLVNLPTFCPVMSLNRNIHGPPTHLQKLLFSATLTRNPGKIASLRLVRPRYIAAAAQDGTINVDTTSALVASHTNESTTTSADQPTQQRYILPASLTQYACVCADPSEKPLYLLMLMYRYNVRSTLCFTKSVESTERLCAILKQFAEQYPLNGHCFRVAYYSSSLAPGARVSTLKQFNRGEIDLLVCTDALSRGVDLISTIGTPTDDASTTPSQIAGARTIINYDSSPHIKTYVHRVGRTARAGNNGSAYTILSKHECRHWKEMMRKHDLYASVQRITDHQLLRPAESVDGEGAALGYDVMAERYAGVLAAVRAKLGHDASNPYL